MTGLEIAAVVHVHVPIQRHSKLSLVKRSFNPVMYRVSSRGNPRDQDKIHVLQLIPVTVMDVWFSLETYAMKTRYCSYDEFWTFVVLCFRCHFDNFRCIQWWKFRQKDDISVSFYHNLSTCAKNKTLKGYNENCFIIKLCLLNAVVAVINIKKISTLHTYEFLSNQYILDYRLLKFCFKYDACHVVFIVLYCIVFCILLWNKIH